MSQLPSRAQRHPINPPLHNHHCAHQHHCRREAESAGWDRIVLFYLTSLSPSGFSNPNHTVASLS